MVAVDSRAFLFVFVLVLAALFAGAPAIAANPLPAPTGKVLLSVSGAITNTTDGETAVFDRMQLQALGVHTLRTSNPFVQGVHTFEGVRLSDVLNAVGAQGQTVVARALDGYSVDIPVEDAMKYQPLLAMKMDGKVMRVRTKGPIWVIYPVDQYEELKAEDFSARSIWQLNALEIK